MKTKNYEVTVEEAILRHATWLNEEGRDGSLRLFDALQIAHLALCKALDSELSAEADRLWKLREELEAIIGWDASAEEYRDQARCPACLGTNVGRMAVNPEEDGWMVSPGDSNYYYSICGDCDYEWEEKER